MQTSNQELTKRAESPLIISVGQRPTKRGANKLRAESPLIISVGQRPTKRGANTNPKPQRGVIKISPFQGSNCRDYSFHRALPYAIDC